jgi:NADPH:quinone reductase-like Zn-dependent oxidoreductase
MALSLYTPEQHRTAWHDLITIMARTGAKPLIDRVFSFDQLPKAFDRLADGPMGKVILKVKP